MPFIPIDIPISEFIKAHPRTFDTALNESYFTRIDVPHEDYQWAIEDVRKRLEVKLRPCKGKISEVSLHQIARHSLNVGEKFGTEIHRYHMQEILEVIECVDLGYAMNVRPFRHYPLDSFKHVHHNSRSFPKENLLRVWQMKCKGKGNEVEFQNVLLRRTYTELLKVCDETEAQNKCLSVLLNKLYYESVFRDQSKKNRGVDHIYYI